MSPAGTIVVWGTNTWAPVLVLRLEDAVPFPGIAGPSHAGDIAWNPDGTGLALFRPEGGDGTPKE
jgi:hypothetical protein